VILNIIPESLYNWLKSMKRRHPRWSSKTWKGRYELYESERAANEIPGRKEFEEIDELMRLNLDELHHKETGIYSIRAGELFYLGVQGWIRRCNARVTFLTTEAVITDVIAESHLKLSTSSPIVLDLFAPSDLFPIEVPLLIDRRASKQKITDLVEQVLRAHPEAVIIANGTDITDPEVLTFQRAKGVNGFEERDVFVILTCLSPDQYAELNVVGQWLNIPNILRQHYEDQIGQAVGRNTGFRKSERPIRTVVICPHRLYKDMLKDCFRGPSARLRLNKVAVNGGNRCGPSQPRHTQSFLTRAEMAGQGIILF
jgi:hypothetical protein